MYIEIAADIIQDALLKKDNVVNDSLDLLLLFALNAQRGKHLIYVPCLHSNRELTRQLENIMGKSHLALLRQAEKMHYQLSSLKKNLTEYCVITYEKSKKENKIIFINPNKEKRFEPYNETRLICENIIDSEFFKYIVKFYLKQKGIQKGRFSFIPSMGGGSTTSEVLRHEIENMQFFCLAIADSDRKYPNDAVGDTANKLINLIQTYNPINCDLYIMEKVLEIENLIPHSIIKQYLAGQGCLDIFKHDASFFDMKCGITLSNLFDEATCLYWKNMLTDDLDLSERNEAKNHSSCKKEYIKYIDIHKYKKTLLNGFGSDLLVKCIKNIDNSGKIKPQITHKLMNIEKKDLTNSQYEEWMKIGEKIFSWTCGIQSKRV